MSYCRWSTDDFLCDLYCYESDEGFVTHIAANRPIWGDKRPDPVPFNNETIGDGSWLARRNLVMDLLDEINREPVDPEYAGKHYLDDTLEEFLARLISLKNAGLSFPDYVIENVKQELKDAK